MLQDTTRPFRTLVENADDLLWVTDLDLRFSYVNPAVLRLTGFSVEEMLARTVDQNLTSTSLRLVLERSAEAHEARAEAWQEEVELIRKDGSTVWVEAQVRLLRDDQGRPQGFFGAMRDVSRRKAVEFQLQQRLAERTALLAENERLLESLRQGRDHLERLVAERTADLVTLTTDLQQQIDQRAAAEASLRASEARNRALLAAIPDAIWVITPEGLIVDSHVSVSQGGQAPECPGVLGRHVRELMSADSAQHFLALVRAALDSGQVQVFEFTMPLSATDAATYEARLVAIGDHRVMVIARDVTQHRALTDGLLRAERLAALGQFAAALAHEISNPLQIIQNHLELVTSFPLPAEKRRDYLKAASEEIQRLSRFTTDMLDIAYPRSGHLGQPSHLSAQADVTEVVNRVLFLTGRRLRQDGIQVISDLPPAPPARITPGHLTQVCLNLVMNAADALQGLQDGILEIKLQVEGDRLHLVFTNNGPALDPVSLPRIFEPFYSTKPAGRGLGLWVCRTLLQRCGGDIVASNLAPDRGIAFEVTLPVGA